MYPVKVVAFCVACVKPSIQLPQLFMTYSNMARVRVLVPNTICVLQIRPPVKVVEGRVVGVTVSQLLYLLYRASSMVGVRVLATAEGLVNTRLHTCNKAPVVSVPDNFPEVPADFRGGESGFKFRGCTGGSPGIYSSVPRSHPRGIPRGFSTFYIRQHSCNRCRTW